MSGYNRILVYTRSGTERTARLTGAIVLPPDDATDEAPIQLGVVSNTPGQTPPTRQSAVPRADDSPVERLAPGASLEQAVARLGNSLALVRLDSVDALARIASDEAITKEWTTRCPPPWQTRFN